MWPWSGILQEARLLFDVRPEERMRPGGMGSGICKCDRLPPESLVSLSGSGFTGKTVYVDLLYSCSKHGFCGTTVDFCEGNVVPNPQCGGKSSDKRTIGYYEGWNYQRPCGSKSGPISRPRRPQRE
jgi:hypothetical protein